MPAIIVVGAQWGDEGKGKIVDLLTPKAQHIVRAQGGHTALKSEIECKLRLVPPGILLGHTQCYIASGTAIDPEILLAELDYLTEEGIKLAGRLFISEAAHIVFPDHYKINRNDIRVAELVRPTHLKAALKRCLPSNMADAVFEQYYRYGERLFPFADNVEHLVDTAIRKREAVVFEAAEGTSAAGVIDAAGIGPTRIDHTLGVVKAFTTRVGNGPLPTEDKLSMPDGSGACPMRRFGWFDVVLARESIRLNGIDSIALTKLDMLDQMDSIKMCVGYRLEGRLCDSLPKFPEAFEALEPIYETFPGWQASLRGITDFNDLPSNAKHYLRCIESLLGVPISILSMGPNRECTVMMRDLFEEKEVSCVF